MRADIISQTIADLEVLETCRDRIERVVSAMNRDTVDGAGDRLLTVLRDFLDVTAGAAIELWCQRASEP